MNLTTTTKKRIYICIKNYNKLNDQCNNYQKTKLKEYKNTICK